MSFTAFCAAGPACTLLASGSDNASLQLIQLGLLRQLPVPQQIDGFLERGMLCQRLDAEALVAEQPRVAIDKTQPRFGRDNSF
jgi:hypothetical protein